jgi:AcrR family transcriptional regulator
LIVAKGAETKQRIVEQALKLAARDGLEGLSIGGLAQDLGLSKSGLFAHFGSKEELQVEVLRSAAALFEATVVAPALRAPRGAARLEKLFDLWVRWATNDQQPGGCIFMAVSTELDDREGKPRDFLVASQQALLDVIEKAARLSIQAGDFRADLDCVQFAFELDSIMMGINHFYRLMRDPRALHRGKLAFDRLMASAAARH